MFNTVNNKECGRGQRSVVWLKHVQPCLHHFHVLSTVFSWWLISSFSLGIILLPPSLPPFILPLLNQCDRCLVPLAWGSWLEDAGLPAMGAQLCLGAGCAKVEAPGHPGHPPPLATQLLNS